MCVTEGVPAAEGELEGETVGVGGVLGLSLDVGVWEAVPLLLGLPLGVRDDVGVRDGVADPVAVSVAVVDGDAPIDRVEVMDPDLEGVELPVDAAVPLGDALDVAELDAVALPLALPDAEADDEWDDDSVGLLVLVRVPEWDGVGVRVPVPVGVRLPLLVALGELEGVARKDSEPDADGVPLGLVVDTGVPEGVWEPVPVELPVCGGVADPLHVEVAVPLADAPSECVSVPLALVDATTDAVTLDVPVAVAVADAVVALGDVLGVAGGVVEADAPCECVSVMLLDREGDSDVEGVPVALEEAEEDADPDGELEGELLLEDEADAGTERVGVLLPVTEGVATAV